MALLGVMKAINVNNNEIRELGEINPRMFELVLMMNVETMSSGSPTCLIEAIKYCLFYTLGKTKDLVGHLATHYSLFVYISLRFDYIIKKKKNIYLKNLECINSIWNNVF